MNSDKLRKELDAAIVQGNDKEITTKRGRLLQAYKKEINELLEKDDLTVEETVKLTELRNNLSAEVEKHKTHIDSRYSKEFINKKAKIGSIFTTLPTAVSLAVEKVKTCQIEMKVAKDKKEKTTKRWEFLKSVGMLTATPVVYLGKFALDQWYAVLGIGGYIYYKNNPEAVRELGAKIVQFGDNVLDNTLGKIGL